MLLCTKLLTPNTVAFRFPVFQTLHELVRKGILLENQMAKVLAKRSKRKEINLTPESLDNDLRFWERMAPNYDRHVKFLGKSQEQVIHRLCRHLTGAQRVLDIGTGTANIALALARVVSAVEAVDPSSVMLEIARSRVPHMGLKIP